MSKVLGEAVQVGNSATATQNFTIATANDGTVKIARGNAGATTQDILTVDASGRVVIPQGMGAVTTSQSMIRVQTANGYGSTNTCIRRFSTLLTVRGTDITYADSATLGATFTINTTGFYAIAYSDSFNAAANMGISYNSTQLSTNVAAITPSDVFILGDTAAASATACVAVTTLIGAGTIIRAHTGGTPSGVTTSTKFLITRVV